MPLATESAFLLAVLGLLIYCVRLRARTKRKLEAVNGLREQLAKAQAANDALQQELQKSHQTVQSHSTFLANIGREMRSPLSGVIGMNELLLHTDLSNEQRELTKAAMESSQSLLSMINDLQDLAQLEASSICTTDLCATAIADVVREACAICAEPARRRHLFLNVDIDPTIPQVVLANRAVLIKILSKLLLNAVALTNKGGVILRATKVSADKSQTTVCFNVKDTGVGLTPDELQLLFVPFANDKVAGFGLYLCKELVDTVGGALTVESKKGVGTEFQFSATFAIPDAASADARLEERRQAQDDQVTSGSRPYTPRQSMDR